MIGCCGYLGRLFATFIAPDASAIAMVFLAVGVLGEMSFVVWLVVRGVNLRGQSQPLVGADA
jgi:hypothetical protein